MAIDSSVVLPRAWPRRHVGKLLLGMGALCGLVYFAQHSPVFKALLQWAPALAAGFGQNILISLLAIGSGSVAGLLVGAMVLSPLRLLRWPARLWVQVFRNAPWLVLIYFTT
jgi:polar amino acid transport system permease protein